MPPHEESLDEESRGLVRDLQDVEGRTVAMVASLSMPQFNWRLAGGGWSIGQCFGHLNIVSRLLLPGVERAIVEARSRGVTGVGPFAYSWPGKIFVSALQPGSRLKVNTVREYVPPETLDPASVLPEFRALQARWVSAVRGAHGLDLPRVRSTSPVNSLVRFSIGIWFAATVAHQRRHLAQAGRVRSMDGFPM